MSFEHLSANQPGLFAEPESASEPPAPRVKSARSAKRAAWWEQDLSRTAAGQNPGPSEVPDGVYTSLYEQWADA